MVGMVTVTLRDKYKLFLKQFGKQVFSKCNYRNRLKDFIRVDRRYTNVATLIFPIPGL